MAKRILILFVLAGVLICPDDLSSCIFFSTTVFTSKLAPLDEPRFFRGQLDILQPPYRRIYLMTAYRYLTGIGLSKADQQAVLAKPAGPDFWMDQGSPAIQGWLQVRVQVGAPPLDQIDRFKTFPESAYILNCGDDAFRNAAATVVERSRSGESHDDLRAWVAAQDHVFANCSPQAGPSIPSALPATAARWMQADRAYQIAAAEFYAGQFDAASADFLDRRRWLFALARHRSVPRGARPDPQGHAGRCRRHSGRPGAIAEGAGQSGFCSVARKRARPGALSARAHEAGASAQRGGAHR